MFGEIATRHLGVADAGPVFPGYNGEPGALSGAVRHSGRVRLKPSRYNRSASRYKSIASDLLRYHMLLADLPTPQVLIDHARAHEQHRARAGAAPTRAACTLRPHAKTHKSPVVARWQIERGAVGICCAKVGEAEVFADAGIADIRLPYPGQPVERARACCALMDRAAISIIVDHLDVARGWSEAMQRAGRTLDVLVKVDVGFHRCGIDPGRRRARLRAARSRRCRACACAGC